MVRRGVKVLAWVACALQAIAIIAVILVTMWQERVFELRRLLDYGDALGVPDRALVPVLTFVLMGEALLVYLALAVVMQARRKYVALAVVLLVVAGVLLPLQGYFCAEVETMIIGRFYGMGSLAAYGMLSSVISLVTSFFRAPALVLFAVATGGYLFASRDD